MFGFLFLATQYLQFVLGYSPLAAGIRVLPYADAMSTTSVMVALIAAAGAVVAWRYLPSLPRTVDQRADELHRIGAPDPVRGE